MRPFFVDIHSHVVPSGDDGARDLDEALELCRRAAAAGTRVLYATPHAHPLDGSYRLTRERYERALAGHRALKEPCAAFGLELRLGIELSPGGILVGGVRDYVLEGTDAVLLELPGPWFAYDDVLAAAREQVEEIRAAGLAAILAHPERCLEIQERPERLEPFLDDGALVCFNADSFLGAHDARSERAAWQLLELGLGDLVASDAHGRERPSRLQQAFQAIAARVGRRRAVELTDGSALARVAPAAACAAA